MARIASGSSRARIPTAAATNLAWFMIDANLPGLGCSHGSWARAERAGRTSRVKNTVFFDGVRVPAFRSSAARAMAGKVASTHLELEHGAGGCIGRSRLWERLLHYCRETKRDGVPLTQNQDVGTSWPTIHQGRVTRLFGLRNFGLIYSGRKRSYEARSSHTTGRWPGSG